MSSQRPYRFILSGGGTGGHIYPAIAIAQALQAEAPGSEVLFVGAEGRMEMEKVPKAGYEIVGLPIRGIQRRLTWKNFSVPFRILKSLRLAGKIVKDFQPDAAVGVGGYASGPLLRKASKKGVACLIQEQNAFAGLTNRLLAKRVQKICVAHEGMETYFPAEKLVMTGNPVRQDILGAKARKAEGLKHFNLSADKPVLLIIGGSLGARTINESIDAGLDRLQQAGLQILWQTGKGYAETAQKNTIGRGPAVQAHAFIYEMEMAYAVADLVVSRAGALSLAELCVVGLPSILVPSPNVAEDHQTKNAQSLVGKNAARMVTDAAARDTLIDEVLALMKDQISREKLALNALEMGRPNAAQHIACEVLALVKR